LWSSELLDVAAEISSMKAHLSAFPDVLTCCGFCYLLKRKKMDSEIGTPGIDER